MERKRSRTEVEMEDQLKQLDPSSDRYAILSAARDFKASWVALGERLTTVRDGGLYREWGYSSFEAYARRELRIRQDTANKLTRSFSFLREHEPKALEERTERELPPLDVVDLLSRARDRAQVSDDQLATIREEVFAPEANPTRHAVVKKIREIDPDAFRGKPRGPVTGDEDLRKALLLGERFETLVTGHPEISAASKQQLTTIVGELKALYESKVEANEAPQAMSA